jgi:hypothetical protein
MDGRQDEAARLPLGFVLDRPRSALPPEFVSVWSSEVSQPPSALCPPPEMGREIDHPHASVGER